MSSLRKHSSTRSSSSRNAPDDGSRDRSQGSRRRMPSVTRKHKRRASNEKDNEQPDRTAANDKQWLSVPRPRNCLPAYVRDPYEDDYNNDEMQDFNVNSTVAEPSTSHIAQHNYSPAKTQDRPTGNGNDLAFSNDRDYDSEDSLSINRRPAAYYSRWRRFVLETGPKIDPNEPRWIVNSEWYDKYQQPLDKERDLYAERKALGPSWSRSRTILQRARRTLLRSAWVPLVLRWTVLSLCIAALALGGTIVKKQSEELNLNGSLARSPRMAVAVDAVAILYLLYATFDEYFSPPLGLRGAKRKVGVLLFDLLFIVCSSANATLAFESFTQYEEAHNDLTGLQQSLAAILLIALIAWLMTFIVSVLRVVERIEH